MPRRRKSRTRSRARTQSREIVRANPYGPAPERMVLPRQYASNNPMSGNAKIALAIGGVAVVGAVAYFVWRSKTAAAATPAPGSAINPNTPATGLPGNPAPVPSTPSTGLPGAPAPISTLPSPSPLPTTPAPAAPPVPSAPTGTLPVITDLATVQSAAGMFNTIANAQNAAATAAGQTPSWTLLTPSSIQSGSDLNFFGAMQYFENWANGQISSAGVSIPGVTVALRTDGQIDAAVVAALTYFSGGISTGQ